MGGTLSDLLPKTISRSINESLTKDCVNIVQNTIQNCKTSGTQNQSVSFSTAGDWTVAKGAKVSIGQVMSLDVSCVMSNNNINKIATDLANYLVGSAVANSTPLSILGGTTTSEVTNKMKNDIERSLLQNISSDSGASSVQNQIVSINAKNISIGDDLNISQNMSMVAKSMIENSAASEIINKISNSASADSNASSGSVNLLGGFSFYWILLILLIIVCCVLGYYYLPGLLNKLLSEN